jgi:hypothetical protein
MRTKSIFVFVSCMALTWVARVVGQAPPQYPIVDKLAAKVIEKYQTSTCEQLQAKRHQPPSGQKAAMEEKAVEMLRNDPNMRSTSSIKLPPRSPTRCLSAR